jgi:hypothetical protein
MHRLDYGKIKILNLLGNGEQNTEMGRIVAEAMMAMFLLAHLQLLCLPAQEGRLFITVIEEVMLFMVLPVEIITVKIVLSDRDQFKKR